MKLKLLILLVCTICAVEIKSQVIYNAYAKVSNIAGTTLTVTNLTEPASYSFAATEKIIVMQMQDNVIGTNTTNVSTFGDIASIQSAGLWEEKTISSINRSGTTATVVVSTAFVNTYNTGSNSSLQIISFKRLSAAAFTTTNSIRASAWDGSIGGVVAIEVGTDLTLQHSISTNTLGFRGGTVSTTFGGAQCTAPSTTLYVINDNQRGYKGEGIYKNTDANFANARGKSASGGGGGNHHNGGGGGGGNWTAGGLGGNGYNNCTGFPGGGLGGLSLSSYIVQNRIFMGGGGGGGQRNDGNGTRGGNGGGIVIIKANRLITGATCTGGISITANGETAANGTNDGMGGGGAAGTIILQINTFSLSATCPLTVTANGGNGGNASNGSPHGGGGGGAQGVVVFSATQPTANITVATNNGIPGCNNNSSPCNNSAGAPSGTNGNGILTSISGVLPIELLSFKAQKQGNHVLLTWITATETNNDHFEIEKSMDAFNFTPIEKVKTKAKNGNSNKSLNYEIKDLSKQSGTVYYRLKQTDLNANFKYHSIISIDAAIEKTVKISVYPNPNNGAFTADLSGLENEQEVELTLSDMKGKLIYKSIVKIGTDSNSYQIIPKEQLEPGIYLFNMKSEGITYPVKLIVQ